MEFHAKRVLAIINGESLEAGELQKMSKDSYTSAYLVLRVDRKESWRHHRQQDHRPRQQHGSHVAFER
jgi:hypothetical protein